MQQTLLKQLKAIINRLDLQPGNRLPAERKLAQDLKVSRNTLRRLLHMLEGRGLVDIRKGSGTFLQTRFFSPTELFPGDRDKDPEKVVADQLETAFLLFPVMVELAVLRIGTSQLDELRKSNIALSRSIFSKDPQKVWMESFTFFRRIAMGTNNSFMVNIMEEICSIDMVPFKHFFEVNRKSREQIFGDHVNILNALRERNCKKAKQVTREYVVHLSRILEDSNGIIPDSILELVNKETP